MRMPFFPYFCIQYNEGLMKKGLLSVSLVGCFLMVAIGCRQESKHPTDLSHQFDSIVIDTLVRLMPDNDTAICTIHMNIKAAKGANADAINHRLIRSGFLSPDYLSLIEERMSMQQAVDTFVTLFIEDYRRFYPLVIHEENDSMKGILNYRVDTRVEQGRDDIYIYKAAVSQTFDTQSTDFTIVRNIDSATGKVVTLDDLLRKGSEKELRKLLTDRLHERRKDGGKETQVEDKRLIPLTRNVAIGEDRLTFIYVQGEIADRSQGEINIELPYSTLSKLMK